MPRHRPQSQQYCKDIVKKRAGNFHVALRVLPAHKREALYAIYAFARLADDVVDEDNLTLDLETLSQEFDRVVKNNHQDDAYSFHASLATVIRKYAIDPQLFIDLLEGMAMDQRATTYETWNDTELYCYRAAGTIGLICLEVFGYHSPQARAYARDLGLAMQMTNILRDLREDRQRGRLYLPAEDFQDFGLNVDDFFNGRVTQKAQAFMSFQVDRARTLFENADNLFPLVEKDSAFCPRALSLIYREYLHMLEKDPLLSLKKRLSIPKSKKIALTLKSKFFKK